MSDSLCNVPPSPRPRARVIDTIAAKIALFRASYLTSLIFLASPNAIICIALMMSCIIANTVEILAAPHTKLRAIDVADVTSPRECHSVLRRYLCYELYRCSPLI